MRKNLLRLSLATLSLAFATMSATAREVEGECPGSIVIYGTVPCHNVEGTSCEACRYYCMPPGGTPFYQWWNVCGT